MPATLANPRPGNLGRFFSKRKDYRAFRGAVRYTDVNGLESKGRQARHFTFFPVFRGFPADFQAEAGSFVLLERRIPRISGRASR